MFDDIKVSVVIPVKNGDRFISDAIDSVLLQTHKNCQIIVINDASTDKTQEICEEYEQIELHNLVSSIGSSAARNLGLANAIGHYVAYLDADDFWAPRKLEAQLMVLEERAFTVATTCSYLEQDEEMRIVSTRNPPRQIDNQFFWRFPGVCPAPPSCLMVRLTPQTSNIAWDGNLVGVEDIDYVRRLSLIGPILSVPQPFVIRKIHSTNLSNQTLLKYFEYNRRAIHKMFREEFPQTTMLWFSCVLRFYWSFIKTSLRRKLPFDFLMISICFVKDLFSNPNKR